MKVTILDQTVKKNVLLFRQLLKNLAIKRGKEATQKTYLAWINKKTGRFHFFESDEIKGKERSWKAVQIQVHFSADHSPTFSISMTEHGPFFFDCSDMESTAYRAMIKTIHTLNDLSWEKTRKLEGALGQLAELEITPNQFDQIEEAWFEVEREEAEELLANAQIGTYLFHKGEFAELLEEQLKEIGKHDIHCLTLTFKEWEGKICEKIIIYYNGKWQFFDDDLELSGAKYYTLTELLNSLQILKAPLWAG